MHGPWLLVAETFDPRAAGLPDGKQKHELVPELEQLLGYEWNLGLSGAARRLLR